MNEPGNIAAGKCYDDTDDLELVGGEFGVLERLRMHSKVVLNRDESGGARCRYPDFIRMSCKHVSSREKIRMSRTYPSVVKLGYGIKYRDYKDGDTVMNDVVKLISGMRASDNPDNRNFEDIVDNIISFNGESRVFRFNNNFIAETSNRAEELNSVASDLYMYYCLVGLNEIFELDEYAHMQKDIRRIKVCYELEKADKSLEINASFIKRYL